MSSASRLRREAIVVGERGFVARTTAPRIEQILGPPSGSLSPNASQRIAW